MRKLLFAVACFGLLVLPVMAQNVPPQHVSVTNTDGSVESGWVVSFPTGSSDYFNSRHDGLTTVPGYPALVAGASVANGDFGSGTSYPRLGLYDAALGVDPTGNTPDLATGSEANNVGPGGAIFNYVYGDFGGNYQPASEPQHVAVQLPPGDSATMAVGNDDGSTTLFSGWTLDGYSTPSNGGYNFGLNAVVNAVDTLQASGPAWDGALHEYLNGTDETGDFTTVTLGAGSFYGVVFHTSGAGVLWQLWLSFLGAPVKYLGLTLPTAPFSGGGYFRAGSTWPAGFGGFTFNFVAVAGKPGVKGSVHVSNEVTLVTLPDPSCNWGTKDDGTVESGWVVSFPAGSSDYFNNWFNCLVAPGVSTVTDYRLGVMDFGTTASNFPTSGAYDANLGVDPSGWTPNLGAGYAVAPLTFVPLAFNTTSGQYTVRDFADFPYSSFADDNVHGVVQFPPGEVGNLGVGGDTTPTPSVSWGSAWTLNGYSTAANRFDGTAGWALRLSAF